MKFIVYFHGYGSSPKSDKVDRIKSILPDSEVYAFPIDINHDVASPELEDAITFAMMNNFYTESETIFIGTSLGAWWAAKMADKFGVRSVLINPCYDPVSSLEKYGVSEEMRSKYSKMDITDLSNKSFVFSEVDEVIDHSVLISKLDERECSFDIFQNTSHRFNGAEFDFVIRGI